MRISDEQWATLDGEACRRCRASQEITERAIRVAEDNARQCDRVCKSFDELAEIHRRGSENFQRLEAICRQQRADNALLALLLLAVATNGRGGK